jgi:hypothetical protein
MSQPDFVLDEASCPILRDIREGYEPLERLFGTLQTGMAFGEYAVMNPYAESKQKFYHAIALSECVLLKINKHDYDMYVKEAVKKALAEKLNFLRTIPEFHP